MIVEVMAALRLEAALELARAIDNIVLLEQCERATGYRWVSGTDRARVNDARARYVAVGS